MPRPSRWTANHPECQVAVDNVTAKYQAEIERLRAERDEAVAAMKRNILDLNRGAQRVNARADRAEAEIERLRNTLTSAASSIHDSHRQSPEHTIETCRAVICENNWATLQGD